MINKVTYFSSYLFPPLRTYQYRLKDPILKAAYNADPRAEINFAESSSLISRHIFLKFSNTSANNNALL